MFGQLSFVFLLVGGVAAAAAAAAVWDPSPPTAAAYLRDLLGHCRKQGVVKASSSSMGGGETPKQNLHSQHAGASL
jgi:hypothetical protein